MFLLSCPVFFAEITLRSHICLFCFLCLQILLSTHHEKWIAKKERGKNRRKEKKWNKWSLDSPLAILCTGKNYLFTTIRLANKIDKIHHVYCIICVNKINSTVPTWWMRSSCLASVIFSAFSILLCSSVWITSSSFTSFPVFMFPSLATATGASWENSKRF